MKEAAHTARWPYGTWASLEGGRLPRLTPPRVHVVARILRVRPWPLAIIADTPINGPSASFAPIVTREVGDALPPAWWRARGAAFLRAARGERSLIAVTEAWNTRWPLVPLNADQWMQIEDQGILPPLPNLLPSEESLEHLPAAWGWALLAAACGHEDQGLYQLPGWWVAIGRGDRAVASEMADLLAYQTLSTAYHSAYRQCDRMPERFEDAEYFAQAAKMAETLQTLANLPTAAQQLDEVSALWGDLGEAQRSHVLGIVRALAAHSDGSK